MNVSPDVYKTFSVYPKYIETLKTVDDLNPVGVTPRLKFNGVLSIEFDERMYSLRYSDGFVVECLVIDGDQEIYDHFTLINENTELLHE
jgi:hypothetical protein